MAQTWDYGSSESPNSGLYERKEKDGRGPSLEHDRRQSTADDLLDVLGYQAELKRSRSTWTVAFMSFVLASVPYGLSTTLYYPLVGGGPTAIIWGWCLVCLIIMCLAISLGEITSVYPTAGGVYYQTYMLSPPGYRRIMAWICGWSYFLGNVTITLSVNFGTTLFLVGCINIFTDDEGNGIWATETYQYWVVFLAITLLTNAISGLGNRWLPILDVRILILDATVFLMQIAPDVCNLLDLLRGHMHNSVLLGHCQRRPKQRQLRLWQFHSLLWMG